MLDKSTVGDKLFIKVENAEIRRSRMPPAGMFSNAGPGQISNTTCNQLCSPGKWSSETGLSLPMTIAHNAQQVDGRTEQDSLLKRSVKDARCPAGMEGS